jgi:hypothetical protein
MSFSIGDAPGFVRLRCLQICGAVSRPSFSHQDVAFWINETCVSGTAMLPIINWGVVPERLISLTVPVLVTAVVTAVPVLSVAPTASV